VGGGEFSSAGAARQKHGASAIKPRIKPARNEDRDKTIETGIKLLFVCGAAGAELNIPKFSNQIANMLLDLRTSLLGRRDVAIIHVPILNLPCPIRESLFDVVTVL
jgi:hypothetical protein